MAEIKYAELQAALPEVKAHLNRLREQMSEMQLFLEEGRLLPKEKAEAVAQSLKACMEKEKLLRDAAIALKIPVDGRIEEICEAARRREDEAEQLRAMRSVVFDYFRLTTTAENVLEALEESKRNLMKACSVMKEGLTDALKPYECVLEHVQSDRDADEEEIEYLRDTVGKTVARAVDKGWLSIDPALDIDKYLDDSCLLLARNEDGISSSACEQEGVMPDAEFASEEELGAGLDTEKEEMNESDKVEDGEEAEEVRHSDAVTETQVSEEQRLVVPIHGKDDEWTGFSGYMDEHVSIVLKDNPAASEVHATKMVNQMKDRPTAMVLALSRIAEMKMIPADEDPAYYAIEYHPDVQSLEYIVAHGYGARYVIDEDGKQTTYYVLSSKTCAGLQKDSVAQHIKTSPKGTVLKRHVQSKNTQPPNTWSRLQTYQSKLLADYAAKERLKFYSIEFDREDDQFTRACCQEDDLSFMIVPAVLRKGGERAWVNMMQSYLENDRINGPVLILVKRTEDIPVLSGQLCDHDSAVFNLLRYAVIGAPSKVLDGDLNPASMGRIPNDSVQADTKESDPESSAEVDVQEQTSATDALTGREDVSQVSQEEKPIELSKESVDLKEKCPATEEISQEERTEQLEQARRAYASHRPDVGNVILKGLCKLVPDMEPLEKQYAYATGDPMTAVEWSIAELLKVFGGDCGRTKEYDALALAAWLRLCFSNVVGGRETYALDANLMQDNLLYTSSPALRKILFRLTEWVRRQNRGLDDYLLRAVVQQNGIANQQTDLQKWATEKLENGTLLRSGHYSNRIIETRKLLFGNNGVIVRALQAMKSNDREKMAWVQAQVREYVCLENGVICLNREAIFRQMDETWKETRNFAKGKGRNDPLKGNERDTLSNQLHDLYGHIGEWLQTGESSRISSEHVVQIVREVTSLLEDAVQDVEAAAGQKDEAEGAITVLADTIKELIQRIHGTDQEQHIRRRFYIHLLEEPWVALDVNFLPHIEDRNEQIRPLDFCRRAVQYLTAPRKSWNEVIERIFNMDRERNGGDYGCASVLRTYLSEEQPDFVWPSRYADMDRFISSAQDRQSKKGDCVYLWEQNFTARLEMADGDGWFTTTAERERLERVRIAVYENYYQQNNFGFYGRALLHFVEAVHQAAMKQRPLYTQRLERLKQTLLEEDQKAPILSRINTLIEKDHFGAAESYLQQAEQGMLELNSYGLSDTGSCFGRFVDSCSQLCQAGRLNKNLAKTYADQHRHSQNNTTRTGEQLLRAWPENKTIPQKIEMLLRGLYLDASVSGDGRGEHFHAVIQEPGRIENYPHRIADFGSRLYRDGLDVELVFGNKKAESLFTDIDARLQKSSQAPTLILVNCTITLPERRALARKFAENLRTTAPCLILDRALIMYLAEIPLMERWRALIQCALPFQPVQLQNPFFENSSAEIPPDMFIGRRAELSTIIDPAGANLIYGGRQLGKTALLHRAKTLQHRPEDGSWAVYTDVKDKDAQKAAVEIAKALRQRGFWQTTPSVDSWGDLTDAIEARLMNEEGKRHRLLLLIDEADRLLIECEKTRYTELDQFKRLQNTTEGRFKFVMAGLHNVLRFSQKALDHNSGLPQLQGITVKPLSFMDARELLEMPLSYLGFTIQSGGEDVIAQILFNTNYFPGLVHFYASRLVKYKHKNAAKASEPPYRLDRDVLTRLLTDEDFRRMREDRFKMTLGIDVDDHSYYDTLAHLLCYCCNNSEEVMLYGMTAAELLSECRALSDNCALAKLDEKRVGVLLDELVDLNILRRESGSGEMRYLFNRPSFIEMLGDKEAVQNHLLDIMTRQEAKG